MVETKYIDVDRKQTLAAQEQDSAQRSQLNIEQWQVLIALHRTLLHEHRNFFLASQNPSASPALSYLAAKYSMPARMWCHSFHSFLEVTRHRLPESLDHLLAFVYIDYTMMALLYKTVPSFEDTWIECLGGLARYRMAFEDVNIGDREVWSGVARLCKAAERTCQIGRQSCYIAFLTRPNTLQESFLYTQYITSGTTYNCARNSITKMSNPIDTKSSAHPPSSSARHLFIKDPGAVFPSKFAASNVLEPSQRAPPLVEITYNIPNLKRNYKRVKSATYVLIDSKRLLDRLLGNFSVFGFFHCVQASGLESLGSQNRSSTTVTTFSSFISSHLELLFPASCCIFVPVSLLVASSYSRPHVYGCMMGVSSIVLLTTTDNTSMSAMVSTT